MILALTVKCRVNSVMRTSEWNILFFVICLCGPLFTANHRIHQHN